MREGQATFNRPAFTHLLGQEWLPAIGDLHDRLQADPPARVVDIGCGEGWSTIAMAQAYPRATFVGIDLDEPSIEAARRHAREAGVEDRVTFSHDDAAGLAGSFDAAIIIEALHDMANPVPVLADRGGIARRGRRDHRGGRARRRTLQRPRATTSSGSCTDGASRPASPTVARARRSVATGTVMRPDTLRAYARQAGFTKVEILPIENDFFRFYRLTR